MPTRPDDEFTEEEIAELAPVKIGRELLEVGNVGLPDLPGKTVLTENELSIATAPSLPDAPDSMTEAVIENLRVGAGATPVAEPREERE
jgi:hypothetical protein